MVNCITKCEYRLDIAMNRLRQAKWFPTATFGRIFSMVKVRTKDKMSAIFTVPRSDQASKTENQQ